MTLRICNGDNKIAEPTIVATPTKAPTGSTRPARPPSKRRRPTAPRPSIPFHSCPPSLNDPRQAHSAAFRTASLLAGTLVSHCWPPVGASELAGSGVRYRAPRGAVPAFASLPADLFSVGENMADNQSV